MLGSGLGSRWLLCVLAASLYAGGALASEAPRPTDAPLTALNHPPASTSPALQTPSATPTPPVETPLPESWKEGLGEGVNLGLAAKHPNDVGLNKDPDVFVFEDFEGDKVSVPYKEGDKWTDVIKLTPDLPFLGKKCGARVWTSGQHGGACRYWFPPEAHKAEHPAYFIRMYRKFDRNWRPDDLAKKVGVKGMGICCLKAKFDGRGGAVAGGTCDGTNWYTVEDQLVGWAGKSAGSQDGYLWFSHLYSYMPFPKEVSAKLGDLNVNELPTTRFSCYAKKYEYIQYERWYCYEVGLYLNTPGKRDGEARYWIDGVLQARVTNMCFRTAADALPEIATLNLYRTTEKFDQPMTMWMDDLVIARRYIGPAKVEKPAEKPDESAKK